MQNIIGIRREDKNQWERRTPIIPEHLKELREGHYITFLVQPSLNRIFEDKDYKEAGAIISEDLSSCDVIFGVKEMPLDFFQEKKTYIFFSHTIKAQEYNMPLLKKIMNLGSTLIDYEKITDDQGHRRIFFGDHAGIAGMVDTLWALGQRLKFQGIDNPFAKIMQANKYKDLVEIEKALDKVGEEIKEKGFPKEIVPLTIGVAGYGHVSRGTRRMLNHFPSIKIKASELLKLKENNEISAHHIYKVVFEEKDMVETKDPKEEFELKDYFDNPEKYKGVFSRYIPHLTVLINAIYWEERYPRLFTMNQAEKMWLKGEKKLQVIGDISCDVKGAIEMNLHVTNSGNPIYTYNPMTRKAINGYKGEGIVVMAVDNLPTEVPKEASEDFSKSLVHVVPEIAACNFSESFKNLQVSEMIKRATIVQRGVLTPRYQYLKEFVKDIEV